MAQPARRKMPKSDPQPGEAPDAPHDHRGSKMLSLVKELFSYMAARKKWWLLPTILVLLIFGGLLVLAQGSAIAPFIYTVF